MDILEIQEKFEDLLLANPDFDESLLGKDEEGCYSDSDIQHMYSMFEAGTEVREQWQSAKAQAVPEGFVLVPKNPTHKMMEASWASLDAGSADEWWDVYEEVMKAAQEPAND